MTALAADKQVKTRKADISRYPAGVDVFYKGAMVCIDSTGYALPAGKVSGYSEVVGLVGAQVDNSGGSAGDLDISAESGFIAYLTAVSGSQALVGEQAFAIDDQTVGGKASAGVTNLSPIVGRFVEYVSATEMGVFIPTGQPRQSELEVAVVAGAAAGNITVTGINLGDKIISVLVFTTAASIATLADLTSEFSITAADTINNTGGTSTANNSVVVIYEKRA